MYRIAIAIILASLGISLATAQGSKAEPVNVQQVFAFALNYNLATEGNSNVNVSLNYGSYLTLLDNYEVNLVPSYQASLNVYYKGLGSNYINNKFNIDFHHSVALTTAWVRGGTEWWSRKGFYFINSTYLKSASIIPLESRASLTVASNFILNNQNRNQNYGCMTLQPLPNVRVQYYNDGGPGVSQVGLGDKWDRWWTGGGFLEVGNDFNGVDRQAHPKFSLAYYRFTWENEKLYQISSLFGLPYIPLSKENIGNVFSNSGQYAFSVSWRNEDYHLRFNNVLPDVQDLIHGRINNARHNTFANKYLGVGMTKTVRFGL